MNHRLTPERLAELIEQHRRLLMDAHESLRNPDSTWECERHGASVGMRALIAEEARIRDTLLALELFAKTISSGKLVLSHLTR